MSNEAELVNRSCAIVFRMCGKQMRDTVSRRLLVITGVVAYGVQCVFCLLNTRALSLSLTHAYSHLSPLFSLLSSLLLISLFTFLFSSPLSV